MQGKGKRFPVGMNGNSGRLFCNWVIENLDIRGGCRDVGLVLTVSVQNKVFCFVEGGMVYLARFPMGRDVAREYCVCLESCIEEPAFRQSWR